MLVWKTCSDVLPLPKQQANHLIRSKSQQKQHDTSQLFPEGKQTTKPASSWRSRYHIMENSLFCFFAINNSDTNSINNWLYTNDKMTLSCLLAKKGRQTGRWWMNVKKWNLWWQVGKDEQIMVYFFLCTSVTAQLFTGHSPTLACKSDAPFSQLG